MLGIYPIILLVALGTAIISSIFLAWRFKAITRLKLYFNEKDDEPRILNADVPRPFRNDQGVIVMRDLESTGQESSNSAPRRQMNVGAPVAKSLKGRFPNVKGKERAPSPVEEDKPEKKTFGAGVTNFFKFGRGKKSQESDDHELEAYNNTEDFLHTNQPQRGEVQRTSPYDVPHYPDIPAPTRIYTSAIYGGDDGKARDVWKMIDQRTSLVPTKTDGKLHSFEDVDLHGDSQVWKADSGSTTPQLDITHVIGTDSDSSDSGSSESDSLDEEDEREGKSEVEAKDGAESDGHEADGEEDAGEAPGEDADESDNDSDNASDEEKTGEAPAVEEESK